MVRLVRKLLGEDASDEPQHDGEKEKILRAAQDDEQKRHRMTG